MKNLKLSKSIKKLWKNKKYREKQENRKLSKETKEKIGNSLNDKKFNNKHKQNMSKSLYKRWKNKEFKQKMKTLRRQQSYKEMMSKKFSGTNNPNYGTHWTKERREKTMKSQTGDSIIKHHIYLRANDIDSTIDITFSKHKQIHLRAYEFLYYKLGKKGVDEYIKWFKKEYGLK